MIEIKRDTIYNNISFKTGVTHIHGADSKSFLQNIISVDIGPLTNHECVSSLLLNPDGKTISAFHVYQESDTSFYLISEPIVQDKTIETLKRFCLRTDAKIENVSSNFMAVINTSKKDQNSEDFLIEDNYFGLTDITLYLTKDVADLNDNRDEYDEFRIKQGAVNFGSDLGDNSIAQEAALDKRAVSFDKGCFLGQELVCRIDSRGAKTPYTYFHIVASTHNEFKSTISLQNEGDSLGEVTSFAIERNSIYIIAKIARKNVEKLENMEVYDITDSDNISIESVHRTIGYFAC